MDVRARITIEPGATASARAMVARLATHSRRDPGCVSHQVLAQAHAPRALPTVAQWRDAASVDPHLDSPRVRAAVAAARSLLAAPPEILSYTRLG
jgi:quinol monooxygenase YgiN